MRLTVMALAMVLTTGIANAQQPEVLRGFGLSTCGEFAHATELEGDYFAWAQGFMSGWNWGNVLSQGLSQSRQNQAGLITYRDMTAWSVAAQKAYIRTYCNDHPLEDYLDAVLGLLQSLPEVAERPR